MAVAPISAPTMTREALRIIACPSDFLRGPPRSRIDRCAVLPEFNVKRRAFRFQRQCRCARHSFFTHCRNRFARQDEFALPRLHFVHPGQNNVIAIPRIEDDHLSIASEGARENDKARSEEHTSELQSLMRISYA